MATYEFNWAEGHANNTYFGSGSTVYQYLKFNVPIKVVSLTMFSGISNSGSIKPVIYNVANGTKVAEGPQHTSAKVAGTAYELMLNSPVVLGTQAQGYAIGFYQNGGAAYIGASGGSSHSHSSTPSLATVTDTNGGYVGLISGDQYSGSAEPYYYNLNMKINFESTVPIAPTNVLAPSVTVGNLVNVSWTHNDLEGDAQAGYQFRWRKK